MPELPLGLSTRKRRTTWTPHVRVVNYLAEPSVANQFDGIDHVQRPGLAPFAEVGDGPIRGVFRQAGTFGGLFFVASGEEFYSVTQDGEETLIGDLPGVFRTTTAAIRTRVVTVSDGIAYAWDGTDLTTIPMPDDRLVGGVAELNGYLLFNDLTPGSARVYYIEPGATEPDGFDFFSTESVPGENRRIVRVGDELWIFKDEGVEVHVPTGDADLPFQRTPGRNYDKGCRNGDTVARFDNSVAWVGDDAIVYRADATPVRISDNALEEQIRRSDRESLRAWTFGIDGHDLYCLNTSEGTFVYDVSSQQWSEFQSYQRTAWRAHLGANADTFVVAGDDELGLLYRLDPDRSNDNGAPMIRTVTGGIAVAGRAQRCDSLSLYLSTGNLTPDLYAKARVRWSDDLETYGDWVDVQIGRMGQFNLPVRINRLGAMRYPGRLFEITISDDVVATIHAAAYNEPVR